jgi:S-adenosylmethionine hydrolase
MKEGELIGEVLSIDSFGNIISNISEEELKFAEFNEGDSLVVTLGDKSLNVPFCSAYGEVPVGTLLTLVGSSNFLEAAANQASALNFFEAKVGDTFQVSKLASS